MLPDLSGYCFVPSQNNQLCVSMPGGATICATFPGNRIPDPSEYTAALMGSLNAGLAPLTPLFDVLDVLIALINCVKAVEQCLGPPPDPSKLVQCFPDLAKKLATLMKIIPQLSVPVMIGNILDVIIAYLTGVKAQLLTVLRQQLRIAAASTRAASLNSQQLHAVVDCANESLTAYMTNLAAQAGPLGQLIALLNAFLDLVGLPEIPAVQIGSDAQAAVAPLTDVIQALTVIRQGLP